ncbi:MAG TPA: hypothetical protein VF065_17290, partial [Ilumatobacter sp.]
CLAIGVNAVHALLRIRTTGSTELLFAGVAWLVVACHMRWLLARIGAFRRLTALLHPVPLWAFVVLFARSTWHTSVRRAVRWNGRRLDLGHRAN